MRLAAIELGRVVRFLEPSDYECRNAEARNSYLESVLEKQHSSPFDDDSLPLWRVVVVNFASRSPSSAPAEYAIIFDYHHAIADGKSGLAVHAAILKALNNAKTDAAPATGPPTKTADDGEGATAAAAPETVALRVVPPEKPLLPAMEDLLTYRRSLRARVRGFLASHRLPAACGGSILSRFVSGTGTGTDTDVKWSGAPHTYEGRPGDNEQRLPPQTRIRVVTIPAATVAALRARCHAEGTSVTAALQVLVAAVLYRSIAGHVPPISEPSPVPERATTMLRCATAIEVRRFLPRGCGVDETSVGLWIDGFMTDCRRDRVLAGDELISWPEARRHRKRIEHEIRKGDCDLGFGALAAIEQDFEGSLLAKVGKPRDNSFSIINVGVFNGLLPSLASSSGTAGGYEKKPMEAPSSSTVSRTTSGWQVSRMLLSQSAHVNGSAIQFCFASVRDGSMMISLNWQDEVLNSGDVDCVAARLGPELNQLVK